MPASRVNIYMNDYIKTANGYKKQGYRSYYAKLNCSYCNKEIYKRL